MPGWDAFFGMCNTAYYNIDWVDSNGMLNHTGTWPHVQWLGVALFNVWVQCIDLVSLMCNLAGSAPTDYSTSIIGNMTVEFIRGAATMGKPFFVSAATRAPHGTWIAN